MYRWMEGIFRLLQIFGCTQLRWMLNILKRRSLHIGKTSALDGCMLIAGVSLVPHMNPLLANFIKSIVDLSTQLFSRRWSLLQLLFRYPLGLGVNIGSASYFHLLLHLAKFEFEGNFHHALLLLFLLVLEELLHGPFVIPQARSWLGTSTQLRMSKRGLVRDKWTFFHLGCILVLL